MPMANWNSIHTRTLERTAYRNSKHGLTWQSSARGALNEQDNSFRDELSLSTPSSGNEGLVRLYHWLKAPGDARRTSIHTEKRDTDTDTHSDTLDLPAGAAFGNFA
jgi:hypothetical protein